MELRPYHRFTKWIWRVFDTRFWIQLSSVIIASVGGRLMRDDRWSDFAWCLVAFTILTIVYFRMPRPK